VPASISPDLRHAALDVGQILRVMTPCAASISACARLPSMSARHRRLSKSTLAV
jgi:hypothetical protein